MSQDQNADRKFLRTFAVVLIALGLAAISFVIIANLLADTYKTGPKSQQFLLSERLQPQDQANIANNSSAPTTGALMDGGSSHKRGTGQQVIEHVCAACHTTKFMNAPQIGNKQEWRPGPSKD